MSKHLATLIESIGSPRVLVIGDLVLDRYVWGDVSRVSPEGPIPVLNVTMEEARPGGAGNVAGNLARLDAVVSICAVTGDDGPGATLQTQLEELGANTSGIVACADRPTAVKTRYMGFVQSARRAVQHILRVDRERTGAVSAETEDRVIAWLEEAVAGQDAVVVSDYDKGLLTERILSRAYELAAEHGVLTVTDPKIARPYSVYRGSTVVTPNRYETQVATGIAPRDSESLKTAAAALREMTKARNVAITLDREGMYVAGEDEPGLLLPVRAREVYDVSGAGDMVASVIAFMLAAGADMRAAATAANAAAGIEVSKLGAAPVSRSEIVADLLAETGFAPKLKTAEAAAEMAAEARRRNRKVVWTNGCFDILHVGHYEYLKFSRQQGDMLIVGLNSDDSVRRVKGPNRPITGQAERARILGALDVVDCVVIFEDDTPLRLIKMIRPDVLVKGADYTRDTVVGADFVESCGGRVALAPVVEGISTTDIVRRIVEIHGNAADNAESS